MSKKIETLAASLGLKRRQTLQVSEGMDTSAMLRQMSQTSFTARTLGQAADVLEAMLRDEDCLVVMTLSGAMTMAGMGGLILEAIDRSWVQCVVATGALIGHGMVEDMGMVHYQADPQISDEAYFGMRMDRVYDTLETEDNLNDLEQLIRQLLVELADERQGEPVGSAELLAHLGRRLGGEGILQRAGRAGVPIYIPAFTDSELALDIGVHRVLRREAGKDPLRYDAFADLEGFRSLCVGAVTGGKRLGIFTIGGGVPRNWAQQVGPYVDVLNHRVKTDYPQVRYTYGVRVCPDPPHFGHLSGCTYSEGVSWGKFLPPAEGGRFAEVLMDATVAWPLLTRAMIERGL